MTAAAIDIPTAYEADQWLYLAESQCPSMRYRPGRTHDLEGKPIDPQDNGQLQFHRAPHIFRFLAPGNGFGKTACVSVEIDWWVQGDHPWQTDVPKHRPRRVLFVCQKFQQWGELRKDVEAWWTRPFTYVQSPFWTYTWPNGSQVTVVPSESDWQTIQGIQLDLVVVDEECKAELFRELMKRRRGEFNTRFCMSATATRGLQWPYQDFYKPWKEYHEKQGIGDEREMMRKQLHRFDDPALADMPGIWFWPRGGLLDNPTTTAAKWAFYLQTTPGNAAQRHVRLYGGYREFSGTPVFELDQLELMRKGLAPGRTGRIERRAAA